MVDPFAQLGAVYQSSSKQDPFAALGATYQDDSAADEPSLGQKALIATGRGMVDIGEGAKQLYLEGAEKLGLKPEGTAKEYTRQAEQERQVYENTPIGKSKVGKAVRFATNVAPYVAALPAGVGSLLARALIGGATNAGIGFSQFVPEGGSRLQNTLISGGIGAVMPPVIAGTAAANPLIKYGSRGIVGGGTGMAGAALFGQDPIVGGLLGMAGGLASPLAAKSFNAIRGGTEKPAEKAVIEAGKQWKVPVAAGDVSDDPLISATSELLEDVPLSGMRALRRKQMQASQEAAGSLTDRLSREMIDTPFGGKTGMRQIQQAAASNGKRAAAAKELLGDIESAGDDWNRIIQTSENTKLLRSKLIADKKYDLLEREANKFGAIPLTKSLSAIDDSIAQVNKLALPNNQLLTQLNTLKESLSSRQYNFSDLRNVRSEVSDLIDDYFTGANQAVGKKGVGALQSLKNSITDDLNNFAKSNGPQLKTLWKNADNFYQSAIAPAKDRLLAQSLKNADPDTIYSKWIMRGNKKDRATRFYNSLDDKGKAAVRYGMVNDALELATKDKGMFSPGRMASELEKIRGARGAFFKGKDKAEIDGFTNLMRHVDRSYQALNKPDTGVKTVPLLISSILGYGAHAAGVGTGAIAAGAAGLGLIRALFTTDAGRRFLLSSSKLPPGSPAMQKAVQNISNVLQRSTVLEATKAEESN